MADAHPDSDYTPRYGQVRARALEATGKPVGSFVALSASDFRRPESERPVIHTRIETTIDIKMTAGFFAPLMRMTCEMQLDQLAQLRKWLDGDLRSQRRQRRVCMALAQFGGFEEGETFGLFLNSFNAAGAFVQRVLPGCRGRRDGDCIFLMPPPNARLPKEAREAFRVQRVVPVKGADPFAVALLGAALQVMADIVRADLTDLASEEA